MRRPIGEVLGALAEVGDAIAARLAGLEDRRAVVASARWKQRAEHTVERLIQVATGLNEDDVRSIGKEPPEQLWELDRGRFAMTELLAAARMARTALGTQDLRAVLDAVRSIPQVWTQPIDALAAEARRVLETHSASPPFDQGSEVARWFREARGFGQVDPLDVDALLADWKIHVEAIRLASRKVDAISCWGPRHGPAIVLNRRGRHARMYARRATLAHEIGHLLMDRKGALPLVEVLGGRVSESVEARARAFAAEVLLPKASAGRLVLASGDVRAGVLAASERFRVSLELVAWQVRNSGEPLTAEDRSYLRSLVSDPGRF